MPQPKLTLTYSDEDKARLDRAAKIALANGEDIADPRKQGLPSRSAFIRLLVDAYLAEHDPK
jgi:hypothetical protein